MLRGYQVITPELPTQPQKALQMLKDICKEENPELVVGWNSGGFFAQQLTDYNRILISPEYYVSGIFNGILNGKEVVDFPYTHPRSTGEESFKITPALVKSYAEMEAQQFNSCPQSKKMVFAYFWFDHNKENLETHQAHYHDATFLPGTDIYDLKSIQQICAHIKFLLENPED